MVRIFTHTVNKLGSPGSLERQPVDTLALGGLESYSCSEVFYRVEPCASTHGT